MQSDVGRPVGWLYVRARVGTDGFDDASGDCEIHLLPRFNSDTSGRCLTVAIKVPPYPAPASARIANQRISKKNVLLWCDLLHCVDDRLLAVQLS